MSQLYESDHTRGMEALFDLSSEMIVVLGSDACFRFVNSVWEKTMGFGTEDLYGHHYLGLVHLDERPNSEHELARASVGQGGNAFENRFRSMDGSYKWLQWKTTAVSERSLIYGIARDITALKAAAEACEAKYRSLIENAMLGIYRSTLDGRFLEVNHALAAMLGYESREDLIDKNLETDIYLRSGERSRLIEQYGNVERMDGLVVHWKHRNGTPISVRLSGRKVRDTNGVIEGFEVIAEQVHEELRIRPVA